MGYQPSENGQPYWPHPWNKDAVEESSRLDITIEPRRSRTSDLVVGTLSLALLGLSGGLLYSCREDSKRAQEINSFQSVGGREVYRQQRIARLRELQDNAVHIKDSEVRQHELRRLQDQLNDLLQGSMGQIDQVELDESLTIERRTPQP